MNDVNLCSAFRVRNHEKEDIYNVLRVDLSNSLYECFVFHVRSIRPPLLRRILIIIALGYRLDDWDSSVRFPAGAENFSLRRVQNGSGAHPASCPVGTRGSYLGDKAAGS
jgi:hypothetical protein